MKLLYQHYMGTQNPTGDLESGFSGLTTRRTSTGPRWAVCQHIDVVNERLATSMKREAFGKVVENHASSGLEGGIRSYRDSYYQMRSNEECFGVTKSFLSTY